MDNKVILFSYQKNKILKKERDISFEEILLEIEKGNLLDDIEHPNKKRYSNQNIFIVYSERKDYVYLLPYVENDKEIFLKTIIPSRKMTKKYKKEIKNEIR